MRKVNGSLESEILNAVWTLEENDELSDISVSEVQQQVNENSAARAYTTIKTVMDRLVEKKLLERYKDGRKFCYKSTSTRDEMATKAIKSLANQYFNSNLNSLMKAIEKECSVAKV